MFSAFVYKDSKNQRMVYSAEVNLQDSCLLLVLLFSKKQLMHTFVLYIRVHVLPLFQNCIIIHHQSFTIHQSSSIIIISNHHRFLLHHPHRHYHHRRRVRGLLCQHVHTNIQNQSIPLSSRLATCLLNVWRARQGLMRNVVTKMFSRE